MNSGNNKLIRFSQNKSGTFIPYKLIEIANNQGFIRPLSFFISLKKSYRNGVIYSPTSRKLASLTGCSHTAVIPYINELKKIGLIEYRIGKNNKEQLLLKGYKYLTKKWGKNVKFIPNDSKKTIHEALRVQIAISHIKSQEYNIRRKQNGCNRKMKKIVESTENYACLSDRKLAEIMGVSNATANRMKNKWSDLGFITKKPMWSILAKSVSERLFKEAKAYGQIPIHAIFQKNGGRILVRRPDSICIGTDCSYKIAPNSWEPSFEPNSNPSGNIKNNLKGIIR
jgi:DNA-binding transcriptional MocR family regulator